MPGSKSGDVLEAMRQHGITWDQVVPAPKGGEPKGAGELAPDEALVVEASTTAAEVAQGVAVIQESPDTAPTIRREVICERWPLDVLIKAVRGKLPARTSITISN